MHGGRNREPTVIIRRFDRGDPHPATWYRAVTYAADSADRELIGRYPTLEAAATEGMDYAAALAAWRHAHTGPQHVARPPLPAPQDLLRDYRSHG